MANTFATHGPFELQRFDGVVSSEELDKFWEKVLEVSPELHNGVGVYVIGTKRGNGAVKPWYVGRTDQGFASRFRSHARSQRVFKKIRSSAPNGSLHVFLLARINPSGTLSRPLKKKFGLNDDKIRAHPSIVRLEFALIGSCWARNKKLVNVSGKKFHEAFFVPGYLNSKRGKPNKSARSFTQMLEPG